MAEPILSEGYWAERLRSARELHHSVFRCPADRWARIEARHRQILCDELAISDNILDCGCGYGRLLTLLPDWWRGLYLGVDLSPDFIALARKHHPARWFRVADLRSLDPCIGNGLVFDWAVCISLRPMVRRNLGAEVWDVMEGQVSRHARRFLYLEYDEDDPGEVVECQA